MVMVSCIIRPGAHRRSAACGQGKELPFSRMKSRPHRPKPGAPTSRRAAGHRSITSRNIASPKPGSTRNASGASGRRIRRPSNISMCGRLHSNALKSRLIFYAKPVFVYPLPAGRRPRCGQSGNMVERLESARASRLSARRRMSRACVAGLQETYTIRAGRCRHLLDNLAAAAVGRVEDEHVGLHFLPHELPVEDIGHIPREEFACVRPPRRRFDPAPTARLASPRSRRAARPLPSKSERAPLHRRHRRPVSPRKRAHPAT